MNKWGSAYWQDFGERVGTTLIYGLITFLTLDGTTALAFDKLYPVVLLPVLLSALKALLMNMRSGPEPSASIVRVSSNKTDPLTHQDGAMEYHPVLLVCAVVGIVLVILLVAGVI